MCRISKFIRIEGRLVVARKRREQGKSQAELQKREQVIMGIGFGGESNETF